MNNAGQGLNFFQLMNSHIDSSIKGLDAVRSWACFLVIIHHLGFFIEADSFPTCFINLIQAGQLGVAIFFVLSGFLLSLPLWKSIRDFQKMPDLKHYFLRRFARIIPAYYLCLLTLVLFYKLYGSKWELVQVLALLSFTNSFIAAMFSPGFNNPLWSISIEVHCYLLLPLFFYVLIRFNLYKKILLYFIAVFGFLVLWQYLYLWLAPFLEELIGDLSFYKASSFAVRANSLMMFAHFLIGTGAGAIYLSKDYLDFKFKDRISNAVSLAIILLILSSFCLGFSLPSINKMIYFWPTFSLLIAALILLLPQAKQLHFLTEGRFFRFTAKISYGIYLWHCPVLLLVSDILNTKKTSSLTDLSVLLCASLLLTYLLAALSYFLVEKFAINAAKQYCLKK